MPAEKAFPPVTASAGRVAKNSTENSRQQSYATAINLRPSPQCLTAEGTDFKSVPIVY